MITAPSILSADFSKLGQEIESVSKAEYIHIDVMDGHFVPNITIGPVVVKSMKSFKKQVFDVHLMISDPEKYAIEFVKAGADIVTFHYEALNSDSERLALIDKIRAMGVMVGMSIKPNTSHNVLKDYLDKLDLILIMSVEPGFGGQKFMENSLEKIKYLSDEKKKKGYKYLIEVDGGINKETSLLVKEAGVEVCVAGSYIFGKKPEERNDLVEEINNL